MATIHRTTMVPGKLDLLGDWLPRQPCYRDAGGPPTLTRAGGFPLDDPAGDVGIEFTSEHGVLGRRWIYDAAYDPVAVAQLLAFIGGASAAQHQNESGTPDPSVVRSGPRPGG
jgi:hypothetical protein